MKSFFKRTFANLKDRMIFRTLLIYLGGAWVVVQVISLLIDRYHLPGYIFDLLMVFVIAGIPGSMVIAYFHGQSGTQKVTRLEVTFHSIIVLLAIVASIIFVDFSDGRNFTPVEHDENTIAVLPFENMSNDKDDEYFSIGITDDIITQLSKIEDIQVISRFSVMKFKNSEISLQEIADELNVTVILEGSVRRIGNQVRISTQLINVSSDENIWAETYDREMTEVFAVQSDVAQSIAKVLRVKLSPKERQRIERQPTANLDAYDFYLKGREYYYLYRSSDNELAINLFKEALKLDPDYAMAYAGLGDAYAQRVLRYSWPNNWLDTTILMGNRAIGLDPELAEGYKALALGYSYKGFTSKAIEADQRAIELNPNFFPAIANLGVEYGRKGEIDKQIPMLEKTITLVPRLPIPYIQLGEAYASLGDDTKGFEFIEEAIQMQPDFTESYYALSRIHIRRGELVKAFEVASHGLEITPEDPGLMAKMGEIELFYGKPDNAEAYFEAVYDLNLGVHALLDPIGLSPSYLGYVYSITGKPAAAEALFEQLEKGLVDAIESGNEFFMCKVELGRIYAVRGDNSGAIDWLEEAVESGWSDYRLALIDPSFESLKDDRRFLGIITEMKDRIEVMQKNVYGDNQK